MPPRIPIFRSSPSLSSTLRRLTTTTTTTIHHPPSPHPSGLAPLPSRAVIHLSGPDAAKYLQGAITAPVPAANPAAAEEEERGFYAAFLTAQGRVRHDVFVHPGPDHGVFYIDVDAAAAPGLVALIRRYRLRAKFDVRLCEDATVWQAWDDNSSNGGLKVGENDNGPPGIKIVEDTRSPGLGLRILHFSKDSAPAMVVNGDTRMEQVDEVAFRIRRMLAGVPEGQGEIVADSALPLECNMDLMGGIDFHKGCYIGQELTIRTKHRGVVRKRILPCVVYQDSAGVQPPTKLEYDPRATTTTTTVVDAAAIPAGTSIGRVGKKGRSAGKWLGGVGNIGLALCRLEIMTDVTLPGEVSASPYDPADEFVVEWPAEEAGEEKAARREAGRVKVKAFVPWWIRKSIPKGGRWWDDES